MKTVSVAVLYWAEVAHVVRAAKHSHHHKHFAYVAKSRPVGGQK